MNTAAKRRRTRAVGIASMAVGAGAAALVMAAPANAAVTTVTAKPGPTGQFGTSCTYDVSATAPTNKTVIFQDKVGGGSFVTIGQNVSQNGIATVPWTPTVPGSHQIRAIQAGLGGGLAVTVSVDVRPGVNLGSLCLAF